jgi:hypothetical protein
MSPRKYVAGHMVQWAISKEDLAERRRLLYREIMYRIIRVNVSVGRVQVQQRQRF